MCGGYRLAPPFGESSGASHPDPIGRPKVRWRPHHSQPSLGRRDCCTVDAASTRAEGRYWWTPTPVAASDMARDDGDRQVENQPRRRPSGHSVTGRSAGDVEPVGPFLTTAGHLLTIHSGRDHRSQKVCLGHTLFATAQAGKSASLKQLRKLSWRVRGAGGTCTAEVDEPLQGYRSKSMSLSSKAGLQGRAPTVAWISFDGDVYWVRLSEAEGWPRTIRVTQDDVSQGRP